MSAHRTSCRGVVAAAEAGGRLDQVLVAALGRAGEALSRRRARRLIAQGAVYVDRRRVRVASRPMAAGAVLEVVEEGDVAATAAGPPLLPVAAILYEDADLLAVDKPSGLPTQATRSDAVHHLLAAVEALLRLRDGHVAHLTLHHRLDRGTSGVVVLARSRRADRALARVFAERRAEKVYRALVAGDGPAPAAGESWTCEQPLARVVGERGRRITVVDPAGRPARTRFRWLGSAPALDGGTPGGAARGVVEARPETGRTHQLRVHLAAAGWPVVGDRLYGPSAAGPRERLWLHAWRLALPHPATGDRLEIVSPLPAKLDAPREGASPSPTKN